MTVLDLNTREVLDFDRGVEGSGGSSTTPPEVQQALDQAVHTVQQKSHFQQLQAAFNTVGKLKHIPTDEPELDAESNPAAAGFKILTNDLAAACQIAEEQGLQIMVRGANTSGTKNFGAPGVHHDREKIILIDTICPTDSDNLKAKNPDGTRSAHPAAFEQQLPKTNEAFATFNPNGTIKSLIVGAGVLPDQINELLPKNLWAPFDLTTSSSAYMGGVYSTGAMGPSRIRPHEVISKIWLYQNGETQEISDPELIKQHSGLLGLTGAVVAMEITPLEVPTHKWAFTAALDVEDLNPESTNWSEELATYLSLLHPSTNLQIQNGKITSDWQQGITTGIEVFTAQELQFIKDHPHVDKSIKRWAKRCLETLDNKKFLLFVTGNGQQDPDEQFEDPNSPLYQTNQALGGEFKGMDLMANAADIRAMKLLREAVPEQSKAEKNHPAEDHSVFSTSTDLNLALENAPNNPEELQQLFNDLLQPFVEYEHRFAEIQRAATAQDVQVVLRRYGHAHPRNIDLHTRITATAHQENHQALKEIEQMIKQSKAQLVEAATALATEHHHIKLTEGEKGLGPSIKQANQHRVQIAQQLIQAAGTSFNWRAQGTPLAA